MHVPDGFLDLPTSVGAAAVAAGVVGLSLRRARGVLDERTTPVTGLVAVFIFAAQYFNFPVGAGTSGHLMGGALAAVLVGPWLATLAVTVVVIVQALAFADGGITALGTNVLLMAIVAVWAGWFGFRATRALLPRRPASVPIASGIGGLISLPLTAAAFVGLFAIGGTAPVSISAVLAAMVSWHAVIGVGEAVVTTLVVSAVTATRPDLVFGARDVLASRALEIRGGRR